MSLSKKTYSDTYSEKSVGLLYFVNSKELIGMIPSWDRRYNNEHFIFLPCVEKKYFGKYLKRVRL